MKNNIQISQSFKMLYMNPLFVIYLKHSQENKRIFNFSVFDGGGMGEPIMSHMCLGQRTALGSCFFHPALRGF